MYIDTHDNSVAYKLSKNMLAYHFPYSL